MPCSDPIIALLDPFRPVFTAPTWKTAMILLSGALLARGRRTVTAAWWQTGQQQDPHFKRWHHVLNRAHWSPLQARQHLLTLLVQTFVPGGGTLSSVIDEPLERRWGAKIRKRGHSRASPRSRRDRSGSSPGLRWIGLAVVVQVPWTPQRWALPFLAGLATTPAGRQQVGLRPKTLGMWTHQGVRLLRGGLPEVAHELHGRPGLQRSGIEPPLHPAAHHVDGPFRLDSVLHQPVPRRSEPPLGRPRVVGSRLPSLEPLLSAPQTPWQRLPLDWYGEGQRMLDFWSGPACWSRFGSVPLPIRWVLTRDPAGQRPPTALFSTDQTQPAEEIISDFMKRWSLEATFQERRAHLGMERHRQWAELAIERTTPLLFGLDRLGALFGHVFAPAGCLLSNKRLGILNKPLPVARSWPW